MAIPFLDDEFMKYWAKLSVAEKESLLIVARSYVQDKNDAPGIEALRKVIIHREGQNYLQEEGSNYSWDQVKDAALDKSKRLKFNCSL